MKFTFDLPTSMWKEPLREFVRLAGLCEEAGFDRIGVADWRFFSDCFVVMTACLEATTRLEVESLVTDPFVRHPALTACAHATMDELSEGRAILGLGGGREQPAFWGYERPHPVQAVREATEVARRMFAGEDVTFEGRVIRVQNAKLAFPPYRRDLPVLIAARGHRMIELAGEIADIVHLASFFLNVGHHRRELGHVRAAAARGGRAIGSFEIDLTVPCSVADDRAAARRAAKRPAAQGILWMAAAERYSRERSDWVRPAELDVSDDVVRALSTWDFWTHPLLPDHLADVITDELLDQFAVAGTAEECADRLRALARDLPEITGVRFYALPPHGRPWAKGYADMTKDLGRVIALVNA